MWQFWFFCFHLGFPIIGLEADLKDAIAESVAVQGLDGDQALVVVGHGDEPEAFALVGLQVADHFDVLYGTKWAKQLPQDVLFRFRRQIVNKDAPATSVNGRRVGGCRGRCCGSW